MGGREREGGGGNHQLPFFLYFSFFSCKVALGVGRSWTFRMSSSSPRSSTEGSWVRGNAGSGGCGLWLMGGASAWELPGFWWLPSAWLYRRPLSSLSCSPGALWSRGSLWFVLCLARPRILLDWASPPARRAPGPSRLQPPLPSSPWLACWLAASETVSLCQ